MPHRGVNRLMPHSVVCVSALESGEFQGTKCVNFFGKDFASKVTLACCNGGFIAQRRFSLEPLVAQLTHLLLVVGPVRSPSLQCHRLRISLFSIFIFIVFLIWYNTTTTTTNCN